MRYLPFPDGKQAVAPGLMSLTKVTGPDKLFIQIDDNHHAYLKKALAESLRSMAPASQAYKDL